MDVIFIFIPRNSTKALDGLFCIRIIINLL